MIPQHLTLSVSPKGKVHFVSMPDPYILTLCGVSIDRWHALETYNRYSRSVDCPECLIEMEKRGWEVPK